MRDRFERNPDLFTIPIEDADFPKNCRDEAPKILSALQYIYLDKGLNTKVFSILSSRINPKVKELERRGRTGMGLWEIFVVGVMRHGLNTNYDRIHYLANADKLMRTIMGIETEYSVKSEPKKYGLTTIKDNVALLDEDTINEINDIVIEHGQKLLKKKEENSLQIKADTFVLECNVHFPTDLNLLWDSARKCIDIGEYLDKHFDISGWRKSKLWRREIKRLFRNSSRAKKSGGINKTIRLHGIVERYLELCDKLEKKVSSFLSNIESNPDVEVMVKTLELQFYHEMLVKHIDLVERRILNGEVIPSKEKLYSIFETHTEWISKGKLHKPVELGHNMLIATDQHHFIVYHKVVEKQSDVNLAIELGEKLKAKYGYIIESMSFDKGFYSKSNKQHLQECCKRVVMPKKGKLSEKEKDEEYSPEFIKLRYKHSAVESNIHQLEHNGLGLCRDKGMKNFKRYASLSVLSYNLHRLGTYIEKRQATKKAA